MATIKGAEREKDPKRAERERVPKEMEKTRILKRRKEVEKMRRLKIRKEVEKMRILKRSKEVKRRKEVEKMRILKRSKEVKRRKEGKRRKEVEKMRRLKRSKKDGRNMWLQLPTGIVITILMRLDLVDCIRARAVCVSWWLACEEMVSHNLHPPSHQLPWLISIRPCRKTRTKHYCLFNLSDNSIYRLYFPEAFRARWLGSFGGWLILMDMTNVCYLFNLTSKERIDLPSKAIVWNSGSAGHLMEDYWKQHGLGVDDEATLSSDPTSADCTVAISCVDNTFAFCRLGDASWTVLEGESDEYDRYRIFHIIFYNGNVIISHRYELTIYELGTPPNFKKWKPILPPEIEYPCDPDIISLNGFYPVESCGELLMVVGLFYILGESSHITFRIFKMDMSGSCWIKLESLGDQMLFLGCSKSISAAGLSGFKGNSIYFTNAITISNEAWGVFDLEDGTTKLFNSSTLYSSLYLPFWVTPHLM